MGRFGLVLIVAVLIGLFVGRRRVLLLPILGGLVVWLQALLFVDLDNRGSGDNKAAEWFATGVAFAVVGLIGVALGLVLNWAVRRR